MADLGFIIGIIGNVISILMFASPIKTFKQVVKKKSTENYKGLPYITTLLSTSLWCFYGLLKPGGLLIVTVNAAGAAVHILYVAVFLIYAPKHIKLNSIKLVAAVNVAFYGAVVLITLLAFTGNLRITIVGILCAGLTVGMYAAPLSVMRTVIKMKSVKYMPFFLSFFQFLNGGVWSAYAILIKDYYIGVPNCIGFLFGSAQLILYMIYRNGPAQTEEDGSVHLVIEMQSEEKMGFGKMKNRNLSKGNSLPKPSLVREYSNSLVKTRTMSPYDWEKLTKSTV